MKLQLAVLFSVLLIVSAARERVLYEAFSGLDCQAADLGSITVRFEDDDQPRFDCTNYNASSYPNYASTSYRSSVLPENLPVPDPIEEWAYVVVQLGPCPITDATEYTIYAGAIAPACWTYHNFTVYVDEANQRISINLFTNVCAEVFELESFTNVSRCREIGGRELAHGSALGQFPMTFTLVPAAPSTPSVTPSASPSTNSPSSTAPSGSGPSATGPSASNAPVKPSKTNNAVSTAIAGLVSLSAVLALCL